jgi:CheY-like chemotaxis protein
MVSGFVRQARGEISIASTPGRGTSVTIWLPRAAAAALDMAAQAAAPMAAQRSGTVLLVDDEPGLREASTRILREAAFIVHAAASADAALALLETLHESPDLLFTDVMLGPGADGFSLARMVRARCPGIGVLYASGYVGEEQAREADAPVLRKPFGSDRLCAAVADALAARGLAQSRAA